jgi:hypothetical protein
MLNRHVDGGINAIVDDSNFNLTFFHFSLFSL